MLLRRDCRHLSGHPASNGQDGVRPGRDPAPKTAKSGRLLEQDLSLGKGKKGRPFLSFFLFFVLHPSAPLSVLHARVAKENPTIFERKKASAMEAREKKIKRGFFPFILMI